ncbi:MAG: ExbD/TolR family protein [Planctomycetota bacterium]
MLAEHYENIDVLDVDVTDDLALIEFLLADESRARFEFALESGRWKLAAAHEIRDPFLWKHPDLDLPWSLNAFYEPTFDPLLVFELHPDGRITSGPVPVDPEALPERLANPAERTRVLIRADRTLPWGTVGALYERLASRGVFMLFCATSDEKLRLPGPSPFFHRTYILRPERNLATFLPRSGRSELGATAIVELCGDELSRRDFEPLCEAAEALPDRTVPLIDAAPDVRWENVVWAIDAFRSAEIFDIYLAAPADDGPPESGVRLIEDPAGHPALSRIIRAKAD